MDFKAGEYISSIDLNSIKRTGEGYGIISGLSVTPKTDSLDVYVSPGSAIIGYDGSSSMFSTLSTTTLNLVSDDSLPRKAVIYITSAGNLTFTLGTISVAIPEEKTGRNTQFPTVPDMPTGSTFISELWIPAGASSGNDIIIYNSGKPSHNYSVAYMSPYSYILWSDSSTYYSKNCFTGQIDYTGSDATTVLQDSINGCTGSIFLKGFEFPDDITMTSKNIVIEEIGGIQKIYRPRIYLWYSSVPNQSANMISLAYINMAMSEFITSTIFPVSYQGIVMEAGTPNASLSNWELAFSTLSVCAEPSIFYENGYFKSWYRGAAGTQSRIGYAESVDGKNWVKYDNNPVCGTTSNAIAYPNIFKETNSNQFWLYAAKVGGTNEYQLWTGATEVVFSSAGNGNPILSLGGTYDSFAFGNLSVWEEDSTHWYMLYEARSSSPSPWHINLATSTDGKVWNKYSGNPVIYNAAHGRGGASRMAKYGNIYCLVFHSTPDDGSTQLPTNVCMVTSTDLINWGPINVIISSSTKIYETDQCADPEIQWGIWCYSYPEGTLLSKMS